MLATIPKDLYKFAGAVAAFGVMAPGSPKDRIMAGLIPAAIAYAGMYAGEMAHDAVVTKGN